MEQGDLEGRHFMCDKFVNGSQEIAAEARVIHKAHMSSKAVQVIFTMIMLGITAPGQ